MPKATLDQPEAVQDEVLDDDSATSELEEILDEVEEETKKKTRKLLSDDNKYVYLLNEDEDPADCLKRAKEQRNELRYVDHTHVEGFRVFSLLKDVELDEDGVEKEDTGEFVAAVLARNQDSAGRYFLEDQGYSLNLAFKRRMRGRAKTKIEETGLMYGKLLENVLFKDGKEANGFKADASEGHKADWKEMYAKGGKLAHYRNDDGSWKEPNA